MIHMTLIATSFPTPTYTPYDVVMTLYGLILNAIIPILAAASTVFAAWWIWNRTKRSINK